MVRFLGSATLFHLLNLFFSYFVSFNAPQHTNILNQSKKTHIFSKKSQTVDSIRQPQKQSYYQY